MISTAHRSRISLDALICNANNAINAYIPNFDNLIRQISLTKALYFATALNLCSFANDDIHQAVNSNMKVRCGVMLDSD